MTTGLDSGDTWPSNLVFFFFLQMKMIIATVSAMSRMMAPTIIPMTIDDKDDLEDGDC